MDNDSYGHVNNVTYYSYFDTAVNEHLIRAGGLDIAARPGRRLRRRDVVPVPSAAVVSRRRSTRACAWRKLGTYVGDLRDRRCSGRATTTPAATGPLRPRVGRSRDAASGRACPPRIRAALAPLVVDCDATRRAASRCARMTAATRADARALLGEFLADDAHYRAIGRGATATAAIDALDRALDLFLARPELGFVWLAYATTASADAGGRRVRRLPRDLDVARHARRQARRRQRCIATGRAAASAARCSRARGRPSRAKARRASTAAAIATTRDAWRFYERLGLRAARRGAARVAAG